MVWFIGLFTIALLLYFIFRKTDLEAPSDQAFALKVTISQDDNEENELEEKDSWEAFNFYSARVIPAKGQYRIKYEDRRGLKTERDIDVKRVLEDSGMYAIDAHCRLRNSHRSFMNDRIQSAINLESGEIVKDLAEDAIAQFTDSGEGRVLAAIEKEWMGIAVLLFVSRSDGQMRKEERKIIASYLKQQRPDINLGDDELDLAIKALREPDHIEFKRIIRDLKTAGDRDRLNSLLICAKEIVNTQKTIAPMEQAALEMLTSATS